MMVDVSLGNAAGVANPFSMGHRGPGAAAPPRSTLTLPGADKLVVVVVVE